MKHPYGFCPTCGANGVSRERRPNGNDRCSAGHVYPSSKAVNAPVKCIVFGCTNHVGEGTFHPSGMCIPCYRMVTTGIVGPSDNFIFGLHAALRNLRDILTDPEGNPTFPGSGGDHAIARRSFETLGAS